MEVKEEVKKEESKITECNLTDLPVADEQADSTKGGPELQLGSWSGGVTNSGNFPR